MNYNNYVMLNGLYEELIQEKNSIEEEINRNTLKIEEADSYIDSFMEKEGSDYKIFSPRNVESIYKEEINQIREEKLLYYSRNQELHHDKNILVSKINRIKSILKIEKIFSKNITVINIQEEDRQRIARDLHDTSLQNLAHLIHKIELSSLYIDQDPVRAKLELSVVSKNLKDIIEEIRSIIFDLRPMTFDDLGLRAALERLINNVNEKNKYKIQMQIEDVSCENDLILLTLYRVAKECILNIIKHAEADKIYFSCKCIENLCIMEVEDNGKGFNEKEVEGKEDKHFGISVMRERVSLLGGKIEINSEIDKGTKIKIEVPLS